MTADSQVRDNRVVISGSPGARWRRIAEIWADVGPTIGSPRLWIAASPACVEATRRRLSSRPAIGDSTATLRQAASRLALQSDRRPLLLGPASRRALLAELAATAERRSALGPLQDLLGSPGLIDHLAKTFRSLRMEAVRPEAAGATLRRSEGERAGGAIAGLYREYVRRLDKDRLADEATLFTLASEAITASGVRLALTVFDLPHPLGAVERTFASRLAEASESVAVGLPGPASGADRLPASAELRAWWQEILGEDTEALTAGEPPVPVGLRATRDRLFEDAVEPSNAADGVGILAGGNRQDTARRTARRVKRLLIEGIRPDEIVLAARHLDESAPRYAETLTECGVPIHVDRAPRLGDSPLTSAYLDLLALVDSDGAFESLLRVVARPDLTALRAGARPEGFASSTAACEWLVRELQVPSGLAYVRQQAERLASARSASERVNRLAGAASAAVGVVETLEAAIAELPREGTPLAWLDALEACLARLGHTGSDAVSRAAGDTLEEACSAVEHLASWRGRQPRLLGAAGFQSLLRAWTSRLRLPHQASREGCVRLVDATTAAGLDCEHLFVVDADESSFAESDADRAMLDFHELAATPSKSITYAYAALDDAAQPLAPSPYVTDAERLFSAGSARMVDDGEPFSPGDARRAAVRRAVDGDPSAMKSLGWSPLVNAVRAVDARSRGDEFGDWEGMLAGATARSLLGDRYGSEHLWSASQLELMATCPYKFFARQVLKMAPVGELALGVDYRRRGSLMHDALAECLTAINAELGQGRSLREVDPIDLAQRLAERIESLADIGKLPAHEAALLAIEARQATDWAERYAQQQRKFDGEKRWTAFDRPLTPTLLEARFGPKTADDGAEDAASVDRPFEFVLPSGERLRVTGRIDRIDTTRVGDQLVFTVIDYKTSRQYKSSRDQMESGKQLQPVLYALAAQELFFDGDAVPVAAGYWAVQKQGFVAPREKELPVFTLDEGRIEASDEWRAVTEAVTHRCQTLVHEVRSGAFPMHNDDEDCGRTCEFRTVCRVGQARSLGKSPAEAPDA